MEGGKATVLSARALPAYGHGRMEASTRERLVLALASTLPAWAVLPAAVARRASAFVQFTDQAVLEMQVLHATRALHLLGPYSRYHWNHPGPFFFYLMAPLYVLSSHATRSIWLSVWSLNVASIAGVSWIASASNRARAWIVFALLLWQSLVLGPETFCDPWGPYVVVLPFELCLFACAALATGEPRWLPLAVLVASFVVQTSVGTLPAALAALSAGVLCGATIPRVQFKAWRVPLATTLGLAIVVWLPTVVEQLRASPGNLTKLHDFFEGEGGRHAFHDVLAAMSEHVAAIVGADPAYRAHASDSAVVAPAAASRIAAQGLLALLPPSAVLAHLRGRDDVANPCVVAAATAAASLYSATHVVGPLMSYLFTWTVGIGLLSLSSIASVCVAVFGGALARVAAIVDGRGLLAAAGAAVVALLVARTMIPEVPYFYGMRRAEQQSLVHPLERYLRESKPHEPVVRVGAGAAWGVMAAVLLQLQKDGVPFAVEREWRFMFGEQFHPEGPADAFIVFGDAAYERDARDAPGCLLLGQNADTYVFASPARAATANAEMDVYDPCP